ncbi:MAG: HD-GYP domain-containing protein [Pseudomonadota bacterium]
MLEVVKILTTDAKVGMYVTALDKPWLETPFAVEGLRLESEDQISELLQCSHYIYVDTAKSTQVPESLRRMVPQGTRLSGGQLFQDRSLQAYRDTAGWQEEFPRALEAVDRLSQGIDQIFDQLLIGGKLDVVRAKKSIDPMISSIIRNPDPCVWLARLKQEDHYTYQHALGTSIWSVALGRSIGLPKADLRSLAMGGMLIDIGKLRLEAKLLNSEEPLSEADRLRVREHVRLGVQLVEESPLMNRDVADMVAHHHERYDGSGYPAGMRGEQIPLFAAIAGLVDCYDAITSHRPYARAISPAQAVRLLHDWKDCEFQSELIESFTQSVGVYPAGSLVELSTGEVAVVVSGYRQRKLRPQVVVMLDRDKRPVSAPFTVDLLSDLKGGADGSREIVDALEPDAFGIDATLTPV